MTIIEKRAARDVQENWEPLWQLFWSSFPRFLRQEKNVIKACLLSSMRAFVDFYQVIPTEEEMINMDTEVAHKFNMFGNLMLKRMKQIMREEGIEEDVAVCTRCLK